MSLNVKFGYDLKRNASTPDYRDYIYGQVVGLDKVTTETFPAKFMLDDHSPFDTQTIGDCVGEGGRTRMTFAVKGSIDFQPDFAYAECKKLDGNTDEGTTPKNLMQVLQKIGICRRGLYPVITDPKVLPQASQEAYDDAKNYRIDNYAKITTIDEVKHALINEGPIIVAAICADNFVATENGYIDMPSGSILGGHCFTVIGYDDSLTYKFKNGNTYTGFIRIKNSWGSEWADHGYAWIPYAFLTFRIDYSGLAMQEMWSTVSLINNQSQPTPSPVPPSPSPLPNPTPNSQPQPSQQHKEQIDMWLDQKDYMVNGFKHTFDVAPHLDKDTNRTVVELRGLSDITGWSLSYNDADKHIVMYRD